jgi:hypothetical protein
MLWICIIISIALLFLFGYFKPNLILISIPITLVVDLICFWDFLMYYESRPWVIFFMVFQLGFQTMFALYIKRNGFKES